MTLSLTGLIFHSVLLLFSCFGLSYFVSHHSVIQAKIMLVFLLVCVIVHGFKYWAKLMHIMKIIGLKLTMVIVSQM